MAINKVVYGSNTLVDLTGDTVSAADVAAGKRFHLPNGEQASGSLNCQILEFTLATHQYTNVTIGTLSDEAYSHIDDDNFSVSMINTTPEQVVNNDDYLLTISNNPNQPKFSDTTSVFGIGFRLVSASIRVQALWCYYPANETNNSTSKGGIGKFWHNGKTLYYKSASYFLGAGTYRVVITW